MVAEEEGNSLPDILNNKNKTKADHSKTLALDKLLQKSALRYLWYYFTWPNQGNDSWNCPCRLGRAQSVKFILSHQPRSYRAWVFLTLFLSGGNSRVSDHKNCHAYIQASKEGGDPSPTREKSHRAGPARLENWWLYCTPIKKDLWLMTRNRRKQNMEKRNWT